MVTKEQSLKNFLSKADEVANGKYLFAGKKIDDLLAVISSSKILYEVTEFCRSGEDIESLKSTAFFHEGGEYGFRLPKNDKQIVALGYTVLKEISEQKINLNEFLLKYFSSGAEPNILRSYEAFIESFIRPFKDTVQKVVEKIISYDEPRKNRPPAAESAQKSATRHDIDTLYLKEVVSLLEEDRRTAYAAELVEDFRADFISVINEMILAAKAHNLTLLRALAVAYKYMLKRNKKFKHNYSLVMEFLSDHGVYSE